MTTEMFLWLAGMFIVGSFVYTIFGMQIGIINNCAMKMYSMIRNDTDFFYSDACLKYLQKVKRRNRIIILLITAAVLFFVPLIGFVGFLIGYFFRKLMVHRATGINEGNISDSINIFVQFAKPGMEEEMRDGLKFISYKLQFESIYKHI